ncbi:hypothetical protein NP233_g2882 [Leucocoprinus birnbaumii]|uniref:Uncharacterized protein n=1 Tax=Leucocoprinus birnbaumii TaxID=56174 RepID=A0AAD5VZY4_9AGAR|nr:hypothetical protein NP233_g2882 [Leucocoprinus birnbaumii]
MSKVLPTSDIATNKAQHHKPLVIADTGTCKAKEKAIVKQYWLYNQPAECGPRLVMATHAVIVLAFYSSVIHSSILATEDRIKTERTPGLSAWPKYIPAL